MSEPSEKSWIGPFLCGLVLGAGIAGIIGNEFILPVLVKEKTDFIHHSAAAMDLGYYDLDRVTGEVRFIWKPGVADAPELVPAPDPIRAEDLYPVPKRREVAE